MTVWIVSSIEIQLRHDFGFLLLPPLNSPEKSLSSWFNDSLGTTKSFPYSGLEKKCHGFVIHVYLSTVLIVVMNKTWKKITVHQICQRFLPIRAYFTHLYVICQQPFYHMCKHTGHLYVRIGARNLFKIFYYSHYSNSLHYTWR